MYLFLFVSRAISLHLRNYFLNMLFLVSFVPKQRHGTRFEPTLTHQLPERQRVRTSDQQSRKKIKKNQLTKFRRTNSEHMAYVRIRNSYGFAFSFLTKRYDRSSLSLRQFQRSFRCQKYKHIVL